MNDSQLLAYFCPLCHASRFGAHWMSDYQREWNKCTSCGYMELQETTKNRITNLLDPDRLTEPFIDPIVSKIRKEAGDLQTNSKDINSKDKSTKCGNCACANKTN